MMCPSAAHSPERGAAVGNSRDEKVLEKAKLVFGYRKNLIGIQLDSRQL